MRLEIDRYTTQTLAGMSLETLIEHYKETRKKYADFAHKDTKTQAYLMTVDGYIQMKRAEGESDEV